MHWARYVRSGVELPSLPFTKLSTLPEFQAFTNPKAVLNPVLLGFMEGFITKA